MSTIADEVVGGEQAPPQSVDDIAEKAMRGEPFRVLAAALGDFYAFCGKVARRSVTTTFRFDEAISQAWFLVSVSIVPAMLVSIPLCVIIIFQINQILLQIGAIDLAGAGAAVAVVKEIGPIVSVLVIAGAGATAICADLGSRKIREEIDALETLGIDPVQRLVVPRVVAATVVAVGLNAVVCTVGLVGGYVFSVFAQGATPGLYVSELTLVVGLADFVVAEIKAAIFGLLAGLTACYLGLQARGGPKGVGDAVNQTVVFSFMLLFAANTVIQTISIRLAS